MNTYLLCREYRANGALTMEYVLQYEAGDMAEVFNDAERNELGSGRSVERNVKHGGGTMTYTNMVVAARASEAASRAVAA